MASSRDGSGPPQSIFIFDNLRARSHLFFRWLITSPQLAPLYHPFILATFLGAERFTRFTRNSEERDKENNVDLLPVYGEDTIESTRKKLELDVAQALQAVRLSADHTSPSIHYADLTQGKIPLMNEHCLNSLQQDIIFKFIRGEVESIVDSTSNPTLIPDAILDSCTPVMLIRHPAMQITSIYRSMLALTQCRPGDEDFELTTSSKLSRTLYDYLCSRGKRPIVVDAEDMLWRTEELATSLCNALGIDAAGVTDTWDPVPKEKRPAHPVLLAWTDTVWTSTGIDRPATKPNQPSVDEYYKEWQQTYAEEVAEQLKELVEKNMPSYEYLRQFKI